MKFKRRLRPFFSCDIAAIEKWLCDMAAKGLMYESCGLFTVKFSEAEPCSRCYRLEYADVVGSHIREEKLAMYEESGWHAASEFTSGLVPVYTDDPEASELYSEPELNVKPLDSIRKKSVWAGIFFILLGLYSKLPLPIGGIQPIHMLLQCGTVYYVLLWLMVLLLVTAGIMRLVGARRLKRYIESLSTDTDTASVKTKKTAFKTAIIALSVPAILLWGVHLAVDTSITTYDPADMNRDYPFLTYEELFPDEYEGLMQNGGCNCSIHETSDILAPSVIELWENGDNSFEQYHVHHYEMRSEALARKMYEESVVGYMTVSKSDAALRYLAYTETAVKYGWDEAANLLNNELPDYKVKELELENADAAYVTDDNSVGQILLIRDGKTFTEIIYVGSKPDLDSYAQLYIE